MCAAMLNVCLARCWFDTSPRGELRGAVAGLHGDRGPLPRFVARLLALGARSSALTNLASVQLCSRLLLAPALVPCYADEVCRLSFLAWVRDCSGTAPGLLQAACSALPSTISLMPFQASSVGPHNSRNLPAMHPYSHLHATCSLRRRLLLSPSQSAGAP